MTLEEVKTGNGSMVNGMEQMLATYDGIVYDVTSFADRHPGGRGLLETAAGLDLGHFFDNYTVHAQSEKAANWLAPLAVGRLSDEDAVRARAETTPAVHVRSRTRVLARAHRKLVWVVLSLPAWLFVRSLIRLFGWVLPPVGRLLARCLPVTVPGLSPGAEKLPPGAKVAVVGGGIAGCSAAWALARAGYEVTVYEGREQTSGNARTFDWDGFADGRAPVKSPLSVTAWPPLLYKNYTKLLEHLEVQTTHMPLSWFINSKVPGYEGSLWCADPRKGDGSLRNTFSRDFRLYEGIANVVRSTTTLFKMPWLPWKRNDTTSMYTNMSGAGMLNPFNIIPLYSMCRFVGISDAFWDIVFTPYYTASFLQDDLKAFPSALAPSIEAQIPLLAGPDCSWQGASRKGPDDCQVTTCVTWQDGGNGLRTVFAKLTEHCTLKTKTRVHEVQVLPSGKKRVYDEFDQFIDVDRVIFACPCNAIGNILRGQSGLADAILSSPLYADDSEPAAGHMHGVIHSDPSVIAPEFRHDVLNRGSNYVEVTHKSDGSINIENQYNFGVQTPGPGVYDLELDQKPVMLVSHALGEGKSIDPGLVRGVANHARAHPMFTLWNVAAMVSLRLIQGRDGVYYSGNWTTPVNCHDMSLLSGFICAHAIGAEYPFLDDAEATKDFHRLRELMGV